PVLQTTPAPAPPPPPPRGGGGGGGGDGCLRLHSPKTEPPTPILSFPLKGGRDPGTESLCRPAPIHCHRRSTYLRSGIRAQENSQRAHLLRRRELAGGLLLRQQFLLRFLDRATRRLRA